MKIFSCIREKFKTYDAIRKEESRYSFTEIRD